MISPGRKIKSAALRLFRIPWLGQASKHAAALVFPPVCVFCDCRIARLSPIDCVCRSCIARIPFRPVSRIRMDCLQSRNYTLCDNSEKGKDNIRVLIACDYEDMIRKSLIAMKFYDAAYMKRVFAGILCLVLSNQRETYDAILPVPLHPLRKRERGYNQAELIARQVSEKTGIPYIENCLIRQKNTKRQSEMSQYAERLQNVSEAFLCTHPEFLAGKRILVLDDILTSGETMFAAATAINEAIERHKANYYDGTTSANENSEGVSGIPEMKSKTCHITGIVLASSRK